VQDTPMDRRLEIGTPAGTYGVALKDATFVVKEQ
jgi:hypothetical protein